MQNMLHSDGSCWVCAYGDSGWPRGLQETILVSFHKQHPCRLNLRPLTSVPLPLDLAPLPFPTFTTRLEIADLSNFCPTSNLGPRPPRPSTSSTFDLLGFRPHAKYAAL